MALLMLYLEMMILFTHMSLVPGSEQQAAFRETMHGYLRLGSKRSSEEVNTMERNRYVVYIASFI